MKLDLINSRLGVGLGPRVYDSLEGEVIQKAKPAPKSVHVAAFRNRQKRLDYLDKPEPTPCPYVTVVDRSGTYIPLNKSLRYRPAASIPHVTNRDAGKPVPEPMDVSKYPSAIADKLKDKLYDVREDSMERRLVSGKLPGATWEVVGRVWVPPEFDVGPGSYEVYDTNLTNKGLNKFDQGKFNDAGVEEEVEVEFLPLHQRKRVQRKEKEWVEKTAHHTHFHQPCYVDMASSLDSLSLQLSKTTIPTTLLAANKKERFDHQIYRSEPYTKTSGMLLDPYFDAKFDKRRTYTFQPPPPKMTKSQRRRKMKKSDPNRSEGGDVDVDVGHLYSMTHASAISPVKYSSSFNSKAAVGMEIPVPTSGSGGGPGAFPGAFTSSIYIHLPDRPSHFLLNGRKPFLRTPIPDLEEKVLPFSVRHRRGPIFEKQKVGGGNLERAHLVEAMCRQVYPSLASQMFPEDPHVPAPPLVVAKRK